MEYRGIRYTVRAGIERNRWTVSIHPADVEKPRRIVTGPRERAELIARAMIDKWHKRVAQGAAAAPALTVPCKTGPKRC